MQQDLLQNNIKWACLKRRLSLSGKLIFQKNHIFLQIFSPHHFSFLCFIRLSFLNE
jgi:hypothetical protein